LQANFDSDTASLKETLDLAANQTDEFRSTNAEGLAMVQEKYDALSEQLSSELEGVNGVISDLSNQKDTLGEQLADATAKADSKTDELNTCQDE
jgi:chromosome segregation ATPase